MPAPRPPISSEPAKSLGAQIRAARTEQGLTLRALAKRADVSPSLLSRVENDKSTPSVSTLYAVAAALGVSLDGVFSGAEDGVTRPSPTASPAAALAAGGLTPDGDARPATERVPTVDETLQNILDTFASSLEPGILRVKDRAKITLDSGVIWEKLTPKSTAGVDFLLVTYAVGGSSHSSGHLMRHQGVEWTYVLRGELEVTVMFEDHKLGPGDTISYHSTIPHRLSNHGTEPAQAICVIFGRESLIA